MDELTPLRSFRAERADDDPLARAAAWRALEAHFDAASAASVSVPSPRRGFFSRRRLFAFAGATAIAALVAAVVVLGSGPTAEPAAAEILHRTAAVATSPQGPAPSPLPEPGQFLYKKFKRLELQSWVPGGAMSGGGLLTRPGAGP